MSDKEQTAMSDDDAVYVVKASVRLPGQPRTDATCHEYMGDALGCVYTSRVEAQEIATNLSETADEYGLHPSTEYHVETV